MKRALGQVEQWGRERCVLPSHHRLDGSSATEFVHQYRMSYARLTRANALALEDKTRRVRRKVSSRKVGPSKLLDIFLELLREPAKRTKLDRIHIQQRNKTYPRCPGPDISNELSVYARFGSLRSTNTAPPPRTTGAIRFVAA